MSRLDELKEEVTRLEARAKAQEQANEVQTRTHEEWQQISDDDPELDNFWAALDSDFAKQFGPHLPTTIEGGKRSLAAHRHRDRLRDTAGNESLPMEERVKAARDWRGQPSGSHWDQYSDVELVEKLTPHPQAERLLQLAHIAKDKQATIKARFAAMDEYRRLRDKFPKQDEPSGGLLLLDCGYDDLLGRELAHEVGAAVAAKTGKSSSYVADIVRANRGADYDVPLADICATALRISEPQDEPEAPRPELTPENIKRLFDHKLAILNAEYSRVSGV